MSDLDQFFFSVKIQRNTCSPATPHSSNPSTCFPSTKIITVFTRIGPTLTATQERGNFTALKGILCKALGDTRTVYLDRLDATQPEGRQPSALLREMIRLNDASPSPSQPPHAYYSLHISHQQARVEPDRVQGASQFSNGSTGPQYQRPPLCYSTCSTMMYLGNLAQTPPTHQPSLLVTLPNTADTIATSVMQLQVTVASSHLTATSIDKEHHRLRHSTPPQHACCQGATLHHCLCHSMPSCHACCQGAPLLHHGTPLNEEHHYFSVPSTPSLHAALEKDLCYFTVSTPSYRATPNEEYGHITVNAFSCPYSTLTNEGRNPWATHLRTPHRQYEAG
ncbi:hypothetical protein Pcinc_000532 [Petrolisthes cinctipes]|uniref:Uncharacterized protein n=1 Tax=Petrolisthes cinctipes TaxID=88211 RepID=A0AAE1L3Z1_PETCI|nr:hypothetical protein Pcinc_000532 [Petrolisthes cinctipes]